jgi:hypothetical protein
MDRRFDRRLQGWPGFDHLGQDGTLREVDVAVDGLT